MCKVVAEFYSLKSLHLLDLQSCISEVFNLISFWLLKNFLE